jgi:hypothetical protein
MGYFEKMLPAIAAVYDRWFYNHSRLTGFRTLKPAVIDRSYRGQHFSK